MERPYPHITVTPKGERALRGGHPWVFDAEVIDVAGAPAGGDIVDIYTQKGRWLGAGFYNPSSKIRVRCFSRNANDRFDEAFWRRASAILTRPSATTTARARRRPSLR